MTPELSLIILTHNAFWFCVRLFRSLRITQGVHFEVVVVDNRSRLSTRVLLRLLNRLGRIDKLQMMNHNALFAAGNNAGVAMAAGRYVLLPNSDVQVRDPLWLRRQLSLHQRGATGLGFLDAPPRADGFCFLVDRDLYLEFGLDEAHPWWWSITKLQAALLRSGAHVQAIRDHEHALFHFGGKSGNRGVRDADYDPAPRKRRQHMGVLGHKGRVRFARRAGHLTLLAERSQFRRLGSPASPRPACCRPPGTI
jgi:hypothetical protein